jgi:hypothetical protein
MIIATLLLLFLGWRVYLHADLHGKKALPWAIFTVAVAVGINYLTMSVFWVIGEMLDTKNGTKMVEEYSMFASVAALIVSLVAIMIIANKIGKTADKNIK